MKTEKFPIFSGKKLKIKRIEAGVKQKILAEKTNMTSVHLSQIETGVQKPSSETLAKLAKGLNCKMEDFFE